VTLKDDYNLAYPAAEHRHFTLRWLICGWFIRYYTVEDRLARDILELDDESQKFEDFAKQMGETGELVEASQADCDLDLLMRLDAGEISNAKTLLGHRLGLFYHRWTSRAEQSRVSDCIEEQLERIRQSAEHVESVKGVVTCCTTQRREDADPQRK
jgi:hypothetical protein